MPDTMFGVSLQTEMGRRLVSDMLPKEKVMLEGRIDIPKLKEAIKEAEKKSWEGNYPLTLDAAPKGAKIYTNDVPRTTVMYALRSHLRGKLHMTKKRYVVGAFGSDPSGSEILPVTMDDQARLIAQMWEEFRLEEEPAEAIGQ